MRSLQLALLILGLPAVGLAAVDAAEDYPVTLRRWDDTAALVRNHGPGDHFYALTAYTDWRPEASRDRERYQLRLTLPDGRVLTSRMPANQAPPAHHLTFLVPRDSVRNILPSSVRLTAQVIDAQTGAAASRPLSASIVDFPTPLPSRGDHRRFGWGQPTSTTGVATPLAQVSPSGLRFTWIRPVGNGGKPFLIATREATNAQVKKALGDAYPPDSGRTDNFPIDDADQPAWSLSPKLASDFVDALSADDTSGVRYRLPTRQEWLIAARAGKPSGFWWDGDEIPQGAANFLGGEPGLLASDSTAASSSGYIANPFGLFHVFGNVAEWATTDEPGQFARLGGHFRTDPKAANLTAELFDSTVTNPDTIGDANDPGRLFVGVRPVIELDAEAGVAAIRQALASHPELASIEVQYDPDRALATLRGQVDSTRARRLADEALRRLWFLSAVENLLTSPAADASRLATLGDVTGPARRTSPLARWTDLVQVAVEWASDLPVSGSDWYVNVFLPGGQIIAHRLPEIRPQADGRSTFVVPLHEARSAGVPDGGPVPIALSLGAPATSQSDPRIVSNVQSIHWLPANPVPTPTPALRR